MNKHQTYELIECLNERKIKILSRIYTLKLDRKEALKNIDYRTCMALDSKILSYESELNLLLKSLLKNISNYQTEAPHQPQAISHASRLSILSKKTENHPISSARNQPGGLSRLFNANQANRFLQEQPGKPYSLWLAEEENKPDIKEEKSYGFYKN